MRYALALLLTLSLASAGCVSAGPATRLSREEQAAMDMRADSLLSVAPERLTPEESAWLAAYAARGARRLDATADRAAWQAVLIWAGFTAAVGVIIVGVTADL